MSQPQSRRPRTPRSASAHLDRPTRDGTTEIALITKLPETVPAELVLDGQTVARIAVADLLPGA